MIRGLMTDDEWAIVAPFLTTPSAQGGRPPADHRPVLDGVLWINRTDAPWRDLSDIRQPVPNVATKPLRPWLWNWSASRLGFSGAWPYVEVSESDKEVKVTAELPGIDHKDVEVSLANGVLTLKGEKKSEADRALYSERWHGQSQRSLQVGPDVDPDKVNAEFKNGVLTVTLSKQPEAQRSVKRIPIGNR